MEAQPKPTSRFSTLNVFGKFSAAKPPPPPPKDNWYLQAKASASTLSFAPSSVASSSHGRNGVGNVQHSPASAFGVTASQSQYNLALPRNMSPTPSTSASTISMTLSASASTYSVNTTSTETSTAGSTFRRGLSKLSALGKRPFFGKAAKGSRQWEIDQDGVKSAVEEDDTISRPYDVHHDLHVDEELFGLPPAWIDSLRAQGYSDAQIMANHRRNRQTYLQNHPDLSPITTPTWPPVPSLPSASSSSSSSSSASIHTKLSQPSSLSTRSNVPAPLRLSREESIKLYGRGRAQRENSSAYTLSVASTIRTGPPPHIDDPYESDYVSERERVSSEIGSGGNDNATDRGSEAGGDADDDTESYASVPPSTPPRTYGRTFRVVNASPMSPPPAYVAGEAANKEASGDNGSDERGYRRDTKVDPARQATSSRAGGGGGGRGRRLDLNADVESFELDRTPRTNRDTIGPGQWGLIQAPSLVSQTNHPSSDDQTSRTLPRPSRNASLPPVVLVDSPPRETRTLELPERNFSTPGRSRQDSQDSLSPDPSITPVKRAPPRPPRLSLHQDFSSDLSDWSASLFSVLGSGDEPNPKLASMAEEEGEVQSVPAQVLSVVEKAGKAKAVNDSPPAAISRTPSRSTSAAHASSLDSSLQRSGSVSGLSIRSKSGKAPSVPNSPPKLSTSMEEQLQGPSTPLFDEVMSLVQSQMVATSPIDVSCLLSPSSRPSSTYLASPNTPTTPDSAKSSVSVISFSSPKTVSSGGRSDGRDSQQTIGAASRWSEGTIVRDATVARTAPATFVAAAKPVLNATGVGARPQALNAPASDACRNSSISMSDFPMPPSPVYSPYNTPPQSPALPTHSNAQSAGPPPPPSAYTMRLPPRSSSLRSNRSSESESSSTSSPMKPLSVAGSDSSHEYARVKSPNSTCHGPIAGGDAAIASADVDGEAAGKWDRKDLPPAPQEDAGTCEEQDGMDGYGAACVLDDWLLDSPTADSHSEFVATTAAASTNEGGTQVVNGKVHQDSDDMEDKPSPLPLEFELNGDLLPPRSRNSSTRIRKGIVSATVSRIESRQQTRSTHKTGLSSSSSLSSGNTHSRSGSATPPSKSIWSVCPSWIAEALEPLREFIDESENARALFADMQEIAEGESGSVYIARVVKRSEQTLQTRSPLPNRVDGTATVVAIKNVPIPENGSPKIDDLRRELVLMSRVRHTGILSMDALYVDVPEKALWIEMELMERSLADVLVLAEEGLILQENVIARMTSDILHALAHLESLGIAHRDVRSDNLLVNSQGVLKMADFSNALQYDAGSPMRSDAVGVVYWQAPEMRQGSYDVRKVDTWSVGATVWEMVESEPPFMEIEDPRQIPDRWPSFAQPEIYSQSLHDFIRFCSSPPSKRPNAQELLMTTFIRSAAPRTYIVQLLAQCKDIEDRIHRRQSVDSQGTVQA